MTSELEDIYREAKWQWAWREGFAPLLTTHQLEVLAQALETDDPRLVQRATVEPVPFRGCLDWPPRAACAVSLTGWLGDGLRTVGEVESYFAQLCLQADERLGKEAECRFFLRWFDDAPRGEVFPLLLEEVQRELGRRASEQEDEDEE